MKNEKLIIGRLSVVGRALVRGRTAFNVLIFVLVCIFFINMTISVGYNLFFQKELEEKSGIRNVKVVGNILARSTEALMAAGEVSTLRRAVSETALEYDLEYCRIVLPGGGILADSDPKKITVLELPKSWHKSSPPYTETVEGQCAMLRIPLDIPGRGGSFAGSGRTLCQTVRQKH